MRFTISTREVAGPAAGTVYTLGDDSTRIEVWPHVGFNCLRWQTRDGTAWRDLLYVAPDFEANPVPTRSGHPVLFPFPNRLRFGRFEFAGKSYQLPLTEATKTHAIHGFTPRVPWRVVETEDFWDGGASITGVMQLSDDVPGGAGLWPSDFAVRVTYNVAADDLVVTTTVSNLGDAPLPFGLGFHPYFMLPTAPDATADEFVLQVHGDSLWPAVGGLPTGERIPVPPEFDFRQPRGIGPAALDHLYGGVQPTGPELEVAALGHVTAPGVLSVRAVPDFRELLVFTPAHRRAVALEPYTCATDAANLAARGVDAGWRVVPPGESVAVPVRYTWHPGRRLTAAAPGAAPGGLPLGRT